MVNGERNLTLSFLWNNINADFLNEIETGWKAVFQGDEYHLFNEKEDKHGNKSFDAVLDFFDYFNGHWHVDEAENQSMMIEQSIRPLFTGTDYVLNIIDNFYANTMSYSKQQNSTERFIYFIGRHNAEFNIPIGTKTVQIRNRIGVRRNDIIIHEDDNLIDLSIDTDSASFCTAIEYYYDFQPVDEDSNEKEPQQSDVYVSPMAEKYGIRYGEPIHDERYSIKENAEEAARLKQEGTWKTSFEVDAEHFRDDNGNVVALNEGDEIRFVIPSKSINTYIRVVEVNEEFDEDDELISASYTFGNENISNSYKKMQYDAVMDIDDLLNGKRKLDYNVLPNAVREATNIINAGESSNFEYRRNGIYGYNEDNPLWVVRMNANGLGYSQDGGQTYQNAITHLGIVADAVTTGQMSANRIAGGILMSLNENTLFNMNTGNLIMENAHFELGGGARIDFTDTGNRIMYNRYDSESGYGRLAGMGVGNSVNSRLPFAYLGTYSGEVMDTLGPHFSGLFVNTVTRIRDYDSANTMVGQRFRLVSNNDYEKGVDFNFFNDEILTHGASINLGGQGQGFNRGYINRLESELDAFTINYAYPGSSLGYRFELTTGASSGNATFRGQNAGTLFYNLGTSEHVWRQGWINVVHANVVNTDSLRSFKENEHSLDVKDAIEYVKNTEVKTFNYKRSKERFDVNTERTLYDKRVGIIYDDIKMEKDYLVKGDEQSVDLTNVVYMNQKVLQNLLQRVEVLENEN